MFFLIGSILVYIFNQLFKQNTKQNDKEIASDNGDMNYLRIVSQLGKASSLCLKVLDQKVPSKHSVAGWYEQVLCEKINRRCSTVSPKIHVDFKEWTSFIMNQDYPIMGKEHISGNNKHYVMIETSSEIVDMRAFTPQLTKVSDHLKSLVWRGVGSGIAMIGECSSEDLAALARAFMADTLLMPEDGLKPLKITSVSVEGHGINLLRMDSSVAEPFPQEHVKGINSKDDDGLQRSLVQGSESSQTVSEPDAEKSFNQQSNVEFDVKSFADEEDMVDFTVGTDACKAKDLSDTAQFHSASSSNRQSVACMAGLMSSSTTSSESQYFTALSSMASVSDGSLNMAGGFPTDIDVTLLRNEKESREGNQCDVDEDVTIAGEGFSCSEGAGESLSTATFAGDMYPDSPAKYSEASSEDGTLTSGAGEALSPTVEGEDIFSQFNTNRSVSSKPPNVMIYSGKKDSQRLYDKVKNTFALCFNPDKYVLYNLKHEQVFTIPWVENTCCLLIASDKIYDDIDKQFIRYFQNGGIVCSFCNNLDLLFCERYPQENHTGMTQLNYKQWKNTTVACWKFTYGHGPFLSKMEGVKLTSLATDSTGQCMIILAHHIHSNGLAILSQCSLDKDPTDLAITPDINKLLMEGNAARLEVLRDLLATLSIDSSGGEAPALTPTFLFANNQILREKLLAGLRPRMENSILKNQALELNFVPNPAKYTSKITKSAMAIITHSEESANTFDAKNYFANLRTRSLGNIVLYTEVITSTMPLIDSLMYLVPDKVGLIAIASRQTAGKGRSGNAWLSPPGCAMFSLHVRTSLSTALGSRLSFLQHLAALAVIEAVCSRPGYQDLDLRLKWPNDLYFGDSIKIGGVLVTSSIMGNAIHANIGIGVNVSNSNPTLCINDIIERHNRGFTETDGEQAEGSSSPLAPLREEEVVARTVSSLEELIDLFQAPDTGGSGVCGPRAFLHRYYRRWIHGGKTVRLESEEGHEAEIVGLDDYGYLQVRLAGGSVHSVQPDGNSLDMTRNLIVPKQC